MHAMAQWNWGGIACVVLMLAAVGCSVWLTDKLREWGERPDPVKPKFSLSEYETAMQPVRDRWAGERYGKTMAYWTTRASIDRMFLPRRKPPTMQEHVAAGSALGEYYLANREEMDRRARAPKPTEAELAFMMAPPRGRIQ